MFIVLYMKNMLNRIFINSASSLKEQSTGIQVVPLRHIILILG